MSKNSTGIIWSESYEENKYIVRTLWADNTEIWMKGVVTVTVAKNTDSIAISTEYNDIVGFGKNEEDAISSFAKAFVRDWNTIVECTDNLLSMETLDKKHRLIKMVKEVRRGLHEDS